jgi:hypothetical protein
LSYLLTTSASQYSSFFSGPTQIDRVLEVERRLRCGASYEEQDLLNLNQTLHLSLLLQTIPREGGNLFRVTPALEKTSATSSILTQTPLRLETFLDPNDEVGQRRVLIQRTHTTAMSGSSTSTSRF